MGLDDGGGRIGRRRSGYDRSRRGVRRGSNDVAARGIGIAVDDAEHGDEQSDLSNNGTLVKRETN